MRQYQTEIHGQNVTVRGVPSGCAHGANQGYRPNVRCKTYHYGSRAGSVGPKKQRGWRPLEPLPGNVKTMCGVRGDAGPLDLCEACWHNLFGKTQEA